MVQFSAKPKVEDPWDDGRDFISLSRSRGLLEPGVRRSRPSWRLWAAVVFLGFSYLALQAWVPAPVKWRQTLAYYLTSTASDWTPRFAQYFSLDTFERQSYSAGPAGQQASLPPEGNEAPALASTDSTGLILPPETDRQQAETVPQGFVPPVAGKVLRPFGTAVSSVDGGWSFHAGLDLTVVAGEPVKAALPGRVLAIAEVGKAFTVRLAHDGELQTFYGPVQELRVGPGQQVKAGQELGLVAGSWLHFAVERGGRLVDPTGWL